MNLDLNTVFYVEFDGIDHSDYPDYCDAYILSAEIKANGTTREATEEEIEFLNSDSQFVYERLMDHLS